MAAGASSEGAGAGAGAGTGRSAVRVPGTAGPAWSRWVGWFLAKVIWNTHVVGAQHLPLRGPVLVAANHTGLMDGPVVLGVARRPLHIMVKDSMFRGPIGVILRAAGQVPVDRESGRSALAIALKILARDGAVGLFPEGNRGRGDLADVRGGVAWLALNSNARVVPVAVLGTRRTGERVGAIPGFRRRLWVEFGEPLVVEREPGTSGRDALAAASTQIRDALAVVVKGAVVASGIALPLDDPNRDRPAAQE
jgi:1-acyl-sn-glycerol-3-phosphate acyltransferase